MFLFCVNYQPLIEINIFYYLILADKGRPIIVLTIKHLHFLLGFRDFFRPHRRQLLLQNYCSFSLSISTKKKKKKMDDFFATYFGFLFHSQTPSSFTQQLLALKFAFRKRIAFFIINTLLIVFLLQKLWQIYFRIYTIRK